MFPSTKKKSFCLFYEWFVNHVSFFVEYRSFMFDVAWLIVGAVLFFIQMHLLVRKIGNDFFSVHFLHSFKSLTIDYLLIQIMKIKVN